MNTSQLEILVQNLAEVTSDHEKRIRWLERVISYGSGAAFAVYFIVSELL